MPAIKEQLEVNVELASPDLFIPVSPGWEGRSASIGRYGAVQFFHFDFTAQALAKIERGHQRDVEDVSALLERRLVTPQRLRGELDLIEPQLHRFPAINAADLRRRVEDALSRHGQ